jgi:hypothetical protein
MPRRPASAAGLVFALLVLATVAAFAWSQRLKRDPLLLDHISFGTAASRSFTPNGDCRFDRERIRFRVTSSDHASVQVISPTGRLIRTLTRDRYLARYNFFTFYWDGRNREGAIAAPGRYKLRVVLLAGERTLVPPGVIRLHRTAPHPPPRCKGRARSAS